MVKRIFLMLGLLAAFTLAEPARRAHLPSSPERLLLTDARYCGKTVIRVI